MSTRLDAVLKKYPEHEEGLRLLASRDPSKNFKYLDWGAKMLASKQALAPEIADITELFHQFHGRFGRRRERIRSDIYTYRPQDLAHLRDGLLKIKRTTDKKRRERERLYRIEGPVEADVIYDSLDLVVRHIKNKQASVHYGLGTKWCIAMKREGYFEDYETHNATFFFFERKTPAGDEFDKVALMMPRCDDRHETVEAFTALDLRVDMMMLAKVFGSRIFDIFREIHERSERYPGSAMSRVYSGSATQEQLEEAFASIVRKGLLPYELSAILRAICCNDAAPQTLLEEVARRAPTLSLAASKRRGMRRSRGDSRVKELTRDVTAALAIHPNIPADVRDGLGKALRRRRVDTATIRRIHEQGRIGIEYEMSGHPIPRDLRGRRRRRHLRHRPHTVKQFRAAAQRFDRMAARMRKRAKTLQRKLTAAKKKRKTRR